MLWANPKVPAVGKLGEATVKTLCRGSVLVLTRAGGPDLIVLPLGSTGAAASCRWRQKLVPVDQGEVRTSTVV